MRIPGPRGGPPRTLLIACGALAREIVTLVRLNGWEHVQVQCLPAEWHNTPVRIPGGVRAKIRAARRDYDRIFVAYADCGTGGLLDEVLAEEGVERIPGPHCYQFYAGAAQFEALQDEQPGTFYLTDFLVRHFERVVWQGLGLDRHPQLSGQYFGNYRRLVYLAQTRDPELAAQARAAAERLDLEFEQRFTGYGALAPALSRAAGGTQPQETQWRS